MISAPESCNLVEVCNALYRIAQKHTPTSAFADVNELLHVAKILKAAGVQPSISSGLRANVDDHIPAVAKQSFDYRMLQAQFRAALSTVADLGRKNSKTHKSDYHAGLHAGLRQAAKIAIMFLNDLDEAEQPISSTSDTKSRHTFIR